MEHDFKGITTGELKKEIQRREGKNYLEKLKRKREHLIQMVPLINALPTNNMTSQWHKDPTVHVLLSPWDLMILLKKSVEEGIVEIDKKLKEYD